MVEIHGSDKEQIDALKQWWKENGRIVVAGLVLGLGGIFGWTSWQSYTASQSELASRMYEQLVNSAVSADASAVDRQAGELMTRFSKTGYASLAAFVRAATAHTNDDDDAATIQLRWERDNASDDEFRNIAR